MAGVGDGGQILNTFKMIKYIYLNFWSLSFKFKNISGPEELVLGTKKQQLYTEEFM